MNPETIVYCVVALLLGMLLAHMLKDVCGCKVVEGSDGSGGNDSVPAPARCDPNASPPQHCPGPMDCPACSPSPCTSPCPKPPPLENGRLPNPCKKNKNICKSVASLYSAKDQSLLNPLTASYVNLALDISTTGFNWDATPQSQKCLPSEVSTKTHELIPYYNIKPYCVEQNLLSPICSSPCSNKTFEGGGPLINGSNVCPVAKFIMDTASGYSTGDFIQYKFWNQDQLFPDFGKCSSVGYCDPTSCENSSDNSSE